MPDKPNVKDMTQKGALSEKDIEFLKDLRGKVHRDDEDRAIWKNKIVISNNQRLGVKRYTSYPYAGAPDIPLPETDKLIAKSVPLFALSSWSPKKVCLVNVQQGVDEKQYQDKAKKAESALNMFLRSPKLSWFKKLCLAADNFKHYGHCIFRIYEEFCSHWVHKVIDLSEYDAEAVKTLKALTKDELVQFVTDRYALDYEDEEEKAIVDDVIQQFKSGEEIIEFDVEKIYSYPQVDVVNPARIIVPAYTENINNATRITYEYWLPKEQLELLMEKEIFLKKNLEDINIVSKGVNDDNLIESTKSRNEGINDNTGSKDLYRIHEICCWRKEKGRYKRKVYTFLADIMDPENSLLQEIDFPFEFDGWNYEKHDNEIKDTRYFNARGTPEKIRALQEMSERCINNMIIRDEMNNTPIWEVLDTSEIMDASIPLMPNQKIPVKQLGAEIRQLNQGTRADVSSDRMLQILKAYTEEYLASSDQLFPNALNKGEDTVRGKSMGIQQNSGPINLEVILWNDTLSKVYTKMFEILRERLGESIYIEGEEITREDFEFPAEVTSNGNLEMADRDYATQKAAMRLQVISNPVFQQLMCVDNEDVYNAIRDWLEKDGVRDPDDYCTDPKQIMQTQMAQMKQQLMQMQQQIQGSQEEMDKNQKDAYKAKRLANKHLNNAEAATEQAKEEVGNIAMQGAEALNNQAMASQAITGRTVDELLAG